MKSMNRYLSPENLRRLNEDFRKVFDRVIESHGEYDLRLRDDSFNIYCRGNSLAKVDFEAADHYKVTINKRFAEGVFDGERFGIPKLVGNMLVWNLARKRVNPFFQTTNLRKLAKNIASVDYSGEGNFEQQIIADNLENQKFIILDRQILHPGRSNDKLDLLVLAKSDNSEDFHFHVVEVKLGNNPDLPDVAGQLERYQKLVAANVEGWKKSYLITVKQLRDLGFLGSLDVDKLIIGNKVSGSIAVFGYPGTAKPVIEKLRLLNPGLKVIYFSFWLGRSGSDCET